MNEFYNHDDPFFPGTTVRSDAVNNKFDSIQVGFEKVEVETLRSIKLPVGESSEIPINAADRRNGVIGFDASGNLQVQPGVGRWRGDWATGTAYGPRDIFRDATGTIGLNNLYIVEVGHTSTALTDDADNYVLLAEIASNFEGTINDNDTTFLSAWSSQKILEQSHANALSF